MLALPTAPTTTTTTVEQATNKPVRQQLDKEFIDSPSTRVSTTTTSSPHRVSITSSIPENTTTTTTTTTPTTSDENEKMLEQMKQAALARMFGEPFILASSSSPPPPPTKKEEDSIVSASGNSSGVTPKNNSTEVVRRKEAKQETKPGAVTTTGIAQQKEKEGPEDHMPTTDEPSVIRKQEEKCKHIHDDTAKALPVEEARISSASTAASLATVVSDDDELNQERQEEEQQQHVSTRDDSIACQPEHMQQNNEFNNNNNNNTDTTMLVIEAHASAFSKEETEASTVDSARNDTDEASRTTSTDKEQQPDSTVVADLTTTTTAAAHQRDITEEAVKGGDSKADTTADKDFNSEEEHAEGNPDGKVMDGMVESDGGADDDDGDDETYTEEEAVDGANKTSSSPPLHRLMVDFKDRKERKLMENRENARKSNRPKRETDRFVPPPFVVNPEKRLQQKELKNNDCNAATQTEQLPAITSKETAVEEERAETRSNSGEEDTPNVNEDTMDTEMCNDPEQEMEDQLEALCRAEVEAETARLQAESSPEERTEVEAEAEAAWRKLESPPDRSNTSTPEPSKSSTVVTPEVVHEPKPETPKSEAVDKNNAGDNNIPSPVSSGPLVVKSQPSGEASGPSSGGSSSSSVKELEVQQPLAAETEVQPLAVQNLYYPHAMEVQLACQGKKFPEQLMLLMTNKVSEESLWWGSEGQGTIFILDCAWFRDCVMRAFFPNNPFRRITHTLKRWGFRKQRLALPEGVMAFHHPLFNRDRPELASKIMLPVLQAHPDFKHPFKLQSKRRIPEDKIPKRVHKQHPMRMAGEYSKKRELDEYNRRCLKAIHAQRTTKEARAQGGVGGGVPPSVRIASLRREGSTSASQDPPCSDRASSSRRNSSSRLEAQPTRHPKRDPNVVDLTEGRTETVQFPQREARRGSHGRLGVGMPSAEPRSTGKKRKLDLQNRPNESICSAGQTHMPGYYEEKISNKYRIVCRGGGNGVTDGVRSKLSAKKRKSEDDLLSDRKKARGAIAPSPTSMSNLVSPATKKTARHLPSPGMDEMAAVKVIDERAIAKAIQEERAVLDAMQRERELRLHEEKVAAVRARARARGRDRMGAEHHQRQYRAQQQEQGRGKDDEAERRRRLASALYGSARPAAKKQSNIPSKPKTTTPKAEPRREPPAASECKPKAPSSVATAPAPARAPVPARAPAPAKPIRQAPAVPAPPAAPRQARPAIPPPPPPPINPIQVPGLAGLGQQAGVGLPLTGRADLLSAALNTNPAVAPHSLLAGAVAQNMADMLIQQEQQQRQQRQHQQDLAALNGLLAASGLPTTGFVPPPPPIIPAAAQPRLQDLLLLHSLQLS